jgi:MFS superfamily sulfate permease-like transporter
MRKGQPRILAALERYDRPTALADLTAGITVGLVALPLALAFAISSGLSPQAGIYTAIVAGALISLLGDHSSRLAARRAPLSSSWRGSSLNTAPKASSSAP